jgi:hypothetical protein
MYSFQPVLEHYIYESPPEVCIAISVIIYVIWVLILHFIRGGNEFLYKSSLVSLLIIPSICVLSWPDSKPTTNIKITAEYVGMVTGGKHNGLIYVQYKLATGGVVTLPAAEGVAYPKYATLYKN